jgi:cell division control protein 6
MSIFKGLEEEEKESLFKEENIFGVDYTPTDITEILCRGQEIEMIAKQIRNAMKGIRVEQYIFGTTGVGKTYVVRGVLQEAEKVYEGFQYAWINCKKLRPLTAHQFYTNVLEQLGYHTPFRKGYSTTDKRKAFLDMIKDAPFILVLDEVDELVDKGQIDLLYELSENQISVILISNVFNWVANTGDMRFQSRASSNRLDFKDYHQDEMYQVLKFIADKGVNEEVLTDDVLKEISKHTIDQLLCDVRKGKSLMYASVQNAMNETAQTVTSHHVEKAFQDVESMTLTQILSNFSKPELLALSGLVSFLRDRHQSKNPATTSNIHKKFVWNCEAHDYKPVSETMMKAFLSRLEDSKIISHETKSYERARGRTNVYSSDYSVKELDIALMRNGIVTRPRILATHFAVVGESIEAIIKFRYPD